LEVLERSDCLNLFGDQVALRDKCKSEEEKTVERDESCAIGNNIVSTNNHLKQPPAPVVSAIAARKDQAVATYNNPVASMSANQPQPPTPVISTTVPQQQRTYNTGALTSTNNNPSNNGSSSSVTLVPQNQYKPILSAPAMPHRPHQVSVSHSTHNNNLNSNANANTNGSNTTWNNNTHNPTKIMHPPQPVSRGISPENAPGVIIDTSKRALPVQNHLGNNSSLDNDSNKRQKRNPYTNNRLSC